jgi:hypothetical protein
MKMTREVSNYLKISCFLVMSLILAMGLGLKVAYAETYQYNIDAGSYEIVDAGDGYQEIKMEGFGQLLEPGKPKLPSKIFSIAIPPAAKVTSVEVDGEEPTELPGTYRIVPAPAPMPGDDSKEKIKKAKELYEMNYQATYPYDIPYPKEKGKFIVQGAYRKYNIVDVRFSPFFYLPKSGRLYFYPKATVTITYTLGNSSAIEKGLLSESNEEVEETAKELLINYKDAKVWYPPSVAPGAPGYEFVIVTTNALKDDVWPIVNWETCKGRGVYVATTEWINANYSGVDLAEKIRNFLRTNLSGYNILKVLLVGDISDVPMRYCYTPDPWGTWMYVPTDLYYAELSQSDYNSWDSDHDGKYGEEGQDSIDFIKEVDVGRIPWSDPDIVESICLKMAEFEYSTDMGFKHNVLLPEAFWDADTDNAVLADMMLTDFFNPAGWTKWRLYEYGPHYYSTHTRDATLTHTNMVNYWSGGHYGYVCWSGHGDSIYSEKVYYDAHYNWYYFIASSDNTSLNDNYPSIIYSNSCNTANPDHPNNLGRQMLRQGGVSFVGATRDIGYMTGWDELSDGWGNTLAYLFSNNMYGGASSVGWSHQQALRTMYTTYGWNNDWYSMFEYVLYGNPDLWLRDRPSALPNLTYTTPEFWSYPIVPRGDNTCTTAICGVSSSLPGNSNSTYYNWAWTNNGSNTAPGHETDLFLDGVYSWWSTISYMPVDYVAKFINQGTNYVRGGRHTLHYNIDVNKQVWETNENDNCWGHQFVWSPYALSDDTPVTRSAPPIKDGGWGCTPSAWYTNDGFSFYVGQVDPNKWWSAVGILPGGSSSDYDLRLWNIGDYTGSGGGFGGGYLEWSQWGGDSSDFVIVNDNVAPAGTYYVGAINYNEGTNNFHIEEATSTKIYDGNNGPYSMSSTSVLDIYECCLTAGEYSFELDQTAGTCDLGMSLYDDEGATYAKSEYMSGGYANSYGDGGDESFRITIPDRGCRALVVWKVDSSDYAKSCTYQIKFNKPYITVNAPNGGETWFVGDTNNITWTSFAAGSNVNIDISRDGGTTWSSIAANTPNDGTHSWVVTSPTSTQCRVRVTSVSYPSVTDMSNANFTIAQRSITVTSPNGGETWFLGNTKNITWTSVGAGSNVNIDISRDGGTAWSNIVSNTPNDGTHSWVVTSPTSTQCRVRVTSVTYPSVTDMSNANFTIAERVSVTLTPDSTTIPRGGTLGYTVTVKNNTTSSQTFQYWTYVKLPNGNRYPPSGELFGPKTVTLSAGQTRSAHLSQKIPNTAPLGTYKYYGNVGPYPTIWDSDSFDFTVTVTTAPQGEPQEEWELLEDGFAQ